MLATAIPLTPSVNANIGTAVTITRRRCMDVLQSFARLAEPVTSRARCSQTDISLYILFSLLHLYMSAYYATLPVTSHSFTRVSTINWPAPGPTPLPAVRRG